MSKAVEAGLCVCLKHGSCAGEAIKRSSLYYKRFVTALLKRAGDSQEP